MLQTISPNPVYIPQANPKLNTIAYRLVLPYLYCNNSCNHGWIGRTGVFAYHAKLSLAQISHSLFFYFPEVMLIPLLNNNNKAPP